MKKIGKFMRVLVDWAKVALSSQISNTLENKLALSLVVPDLIGYPEICKNPFKKICHKLNAWIPDRATLVWDDERRRSLFPKASTFAFASTLFLICLIPSLFSPHDKVVRLYVQDMEQNPIRQVEKAVPFLLQVVVDNVEGVESPEHILGFDHFQVTQHGTSKSTSIVNGRRTDRLIFNYVLRAEQTGTYRLGPLTVKDKDGTEVTSESVQVVVGDKTVTHDVRKQPFFLETQIDKKSLYVGEELSVLVRFYYVSDFENLRIVEPRFDNFAVGEIDKVPRDGKQTIKGQEYEYKEWSIKLYPEKAGVLLIPAIQAAFKNSYDFAQGLMGLFDVFGMGSEKSVQASARSVDVLPLPESKEHKYVTAVGVFDRATFALKKVQGDVGEGIVATCTVTGIGNVETMKAPFLKLPEGLKHYEANSSVKKLESGKYEKTFEYIVQADQPGEFKILAQKFVYFNPQLKAYKSLSTNEASLKIMGQAVSKQNDDVAQSNTVVSASTAPNSKPGYQFKKDQIQYVVESSSLLHISHDSMFHSMISWLLLLFGIIAACAALYWLYHAYVGISWHETYWGYYVSVRLKMRTLEQKQDLYGLYLLFGQVCQRFGLELQGENVLELLKKNNISDAKIKEWQLFVQQLLATVFSQQGEKQKEKLLLLQQGLHWAKELLRCCRMMKDRKKASIGLF